MQLWGREPKKKINLRTVRLYKNEGLHGANSHLGEAQEWSQEGPPWDLYMRLNQM